MESLGNQEIVLDFSQLVREEEERKKTERAKEEYTERARRSGYIERMRKELGHGTSTSSK